ncbi:MAG: hypothetical protein L0Z48_02710 [candidate division Zixibacteria bacterium]|nr:hypothetical protein [candidate division Zixibacteria bacterium]MCI0595435.1 hypothetical protein [candidate division Zixibacteria bacterium]
MKRIWIALLIPLGLAAPALAQQTQPGAAKALNPDISVISNFLGGYNFDSEQKGRFDLDEVEASFQANVDPYSRADIFVAFTPDEVEVEEGYLTLLKLPARLGLKAGKMRANFGKINTLHTHFVPYADRPLPLVQYLGEEGLVEVGMSVSRTLPAPFFLEATAEGFSGDNEVAFGSGDFKKPLFVGHLKAFWDLGEASNLEIGASAAHGYGPEPDFRRNLVGGADVTFRYKPLSTALYRSFFWRSEAFYRRPFNTPENLIARGFYSFLQYQSGRRWYWGARFDFAQEPENNALVPGKIYHQVAYSGVITFTPSEFSRFRLQYRQTDDNAGGEAVKEVLFQANFSIGAHGAHVF